MVMSEEGNSRLNE